MQDNGSTVRDVTGKTMALPESVPMPVVHWPAQDDSAPSDLVALPCPNCGSDSAKAYVLAVDIQLQAHLPSRLRIAHCPACDCRFYDRQISADYEGFELNERGTVPFYVQQNAGVSLITKPLAQTKVPPGSTFMDVGCGFGFSLDYAIHTRGWQGVGIDPVPLAAAGRDALGLPIELRYLRDDDEAGGSMDVVLGSEVVEHVTSPIAFVRTLRTMLKPGGLLILTTPNGEDLSPAQPSGIIIPLLSPTLHLVIQSRTSLDWLLRHAGFAHVEIEIDSHSLVAFASESPIDIERDEPTLRHALRGHLESRARTLEPGSDTFFGYAGRAFQESVNDSDMDAADRAWAMLEPACESRFGLQLDTMQSLPAEVQTCGLERMSQLVPLNLAGLLYARAIRRLAGGAPRPVLATQFSLASQAADSMRRALSHLAMDDGQTEDIGWTARAEAALCAAAADAPDAVDRLIALPPSPSGGVARRLEILKRAAALLSNSGRHDRAREAAAELQDAPFAQPGATLSVAERDALFTLAILDVQDGSPMQHRAEERFARVRIAADARSGLWWAALRGQLQAMDAQGRSADGTALMAALLNEDPALMLDQSMVNRLINAGQYELARAAVRRGGLDRVPYARIGSTLPLSTEERDSLFFLAVLDAQIGPGNRPVGEPALARHRFARVRSAVSPSEGLWMAAFRGELQSLDLLDARDEAADLVREVSAAHPGMDLPADVLTRIGPPLGSPSVKR